MRRQSLQQTVPQSPRLRRGKRIYSASPITKGDDVPKSCEGSGSPGAGGTGRARTELSPPSRAGRGAHARRSHPGSGGIQPELTEELTEPKRTIPEKPPLLPHLHSLPHRQVGRVPAPSLLLRWAWVPIIAGAVTFAA